MRNVGKALVVTAIAAATIGVAAPPAAACPDENPICAAINLVCEVVRGGPCIR